MTIQVIHRRVFLLFAPAMLLVSTMALAAGNSAQMQVKTAEQHATFASKAGNVAQTHLHLHHVINCLVGPKGEGFDAMAGDPCQGQGNGALNDMMGSTQEKETLEQALALAKVGVKIRTHKPAYYTALAVRTLLQEAKQGK